MAEFDSTSESSYSAIYDELFPICRSISGPGLRQSLEIFSRYMPIRIEGTRSGTQVYDWVVPQEWSIDSAVLTGPDGEVVCDFADSNLHVVNYSVPIDQEMSLEDLLPHLHGIPRLPSLVPYVTSYYRDNWGFCLPQDKIDSLKPGQYHAKIVSNKYDGEVNFATHSLSGECSREFLISSYLCHPSMANNELSGPLVLLGLYDRISKWRKRRYTYRFALVPETIGSICLLNKYGETFKQKLEAGLVLTCLGGPKPHLSYKTTRRTNTVLDQLVSHIRRHGINAYDIRPFTPVGGSDERQYCSPGFNLPVGQMARTIYGEYDEYHTSGDNKEFMDTRALLKSVDDLEQLLTLHEYAGCFQNLAPYGEPQLGKRGLYPSMNSPTKWRLSNDEMSDGRTMLERMLYILNYSDGETPMLAIADMMNCSLTSLIPIIDKLEENSLLKMKDA